MKNKYLLLTVLFLTLSITSCDHCYNTQHTYLTNQDIIKGSTFKAGSYFVYKDSVSGKVDSFYVSRSTTAKVVDIGSPDNCGKFGADYEVNTTDLNMNSFDHITIEGYDLNLLHTIFGAVNETEIYTGGYIALYYTDTIGHSVTFLPTYILNGKTYSNVQMHQLISQGVVFKTYFNLDVGLLKICRKDGNVNAVYELINYVSIKQ